VRGVRAPSRGRRYAERSRATPPPVQSDPLLLPCELDLWPCLTSAALQVGTGDSTSDQQRGQVLEMLHVCVASRLFFHARASSTARKGGRPRGAGKIHGLSRQ
jgi:hypothetical protein